MFLYIRDTRVCEIIRMYEINVYLIQHDESTVIYINMYLFLRVYRKGFFLYNAFVQDFLWLLIVLS